MNKVSVTQGKQEVETGGRRLALLVLQAPFRLPGWLRRLWEAQDGVGKGRGEEGSPGPEGTSGAASAPLQRGPRRCKDSDRVRGASVRQRQDENPGLGLPAWALPAPYCAASPSGNTRRVKAPLKIQFGDSW